MKENRKSIWQRSWHPVGGSVDPGEGSGKGQSIWQRSWYPGRALVRWLFNPKTIRICLFTGVSLATVIALFYGEENWRGRRAWQNLKREFEARGERLDIAAFIPPKIPDEQNLAMTPLLKPLFEFEFDRTPGRIGLSWRDTNAMARLNRLRLDPAPTASDLSRPVPGDWQRVRRMNLIEWQGDLQRSQKPKGSPKPPTTPLSGDPTKAAVELLQGLSRFDTELQELATAARQRPGSRFPLDYEAAFITPLPHLAPLRHIVDVLELKAAAELMLGRTDQAFEDTLVGLRLADSLRTEPISVCYLLRLRLHERVLQSIWEGMVDRRWNDQQLATLQQQLQTIDMLGDFAQAMRGERASIVLLERHESQQRPKIVRYVAFGIRRLEDFLHGGRSLPPVYPEPLTDANNAWDLSLNMNEWVLLGQSPLRTALTKSYVETHAHANDTWDPKRPKHSALATFWGVCGPAGWTDHSMVVLSRLFQTELIEGIDVRGQRLSRPFSEFGTQHVKAVLKRPTAFNTLAAAYFSDDPAVFETARIQTAINLATIACALERYALSQGHYPDKLEALIPQHIKKLPHDAINGKPLIYRRTGDGRFILYSTGPNEVDDGGIDRDTAEARGRKSDANGIRPGDWVWRYPEPITQ